MNGRFFGGVWQFYLGEVSGLGSEEGVVGNGLETKNVIFSLIRWRNELTNQFKIDMRFQPVLLHPSTVTGWGSHS